MATRGTGLGSGTEHLQMLREALERLTGARDLDGLLRAAGEALLALDQARVVELSLFVGGQPQAAAELTLDFQGPRDAAFVPPGENPLIDAVLASGNLALFETADVGGALDGHLTHVLAAPLAVGSEPGEAPHPPLGAALIGFAGSAELSEATTLTVETLLVCLADRVRSLLADHERRRYQAHMALLGDVRRMLVQPGGGEHHFTRAIQAIQEAFDLELITVYAGRPLTLRFQYGGVIGRPGEPVPDGLALEASQQMAPLVVRDLWDNPAYAVPPWVPDQARSEVAIPLRYRNRRIGVLDLFSAHPAAFDALDVEILAALANLLAILIVQERWDNQEYTPEQLRQAYDRLQEFTELKDQILQNISHELRTPLTLVKGYLELMLAEQMGPLVPEQVGTLGSVIEKVDEIVRIVEQIVALSPHSRLSVTHQKISVDVLFAEVAEVFARRTEGMPVVWDFSVEDDELYLHGDIDKIRQICYNILDNSIKFSPEGGRISVRALSEESYVHLVFADEGIGIPQPRLQQIFETFYQVDGSSTRRFGGLGLGLAVVNRAVAAHKGKAWAESVLGKGSIFHVLLPKYESPRRVLQSSAG